MKRIGKVIWGSLIISAVGALNIAVLIEVRDVHKSEQITMASENLVPGTWTNWAKDSLADGVVKLVVTRQWLETHSLHDTYSRQPATKPCPAPEDPALHYRSANGTCNDLNNPFSGSANSRFGRNISPRSLKPESELQMMSPNPRDVSLTLLTRKKFQPIAGLNLLAASWIQFMVQDWFNHPQQYTAQKFLDIKLTDPKDPIARVQSSVKVPRTKPESAENTVLDSTGKTLSTSSNENTHWWDGSQIYGSDLENQLSLRTKTNGEMILIDSFRNAAGNLVSGKLPLERDAFFMIDKEKTGFNQHWWVGLGMLHTLFVMEHNDIAKMLRDNLASNTPKGGWKKDPKEFDEQVFQIARLINVAAMAKIQTLEWAPSIVHNPTVKSAMVTIWNNTVGKSQKNARVPFSITEEFTSVFRLHSLLPDSLRILSESDPSPNATNNKPLPLEELREGKSHLLIDHYGLTDLFYSFGKAHPGAVTLNNFPMTLQDITLPFFGHFDLGAVDILRDRERGVPRYNEFRRLVGLSPLQSMNELTQDKTKLTALNQLYDGKIENVDLLIGTLAEEARPSGSELGETSFQIFILMTERLLASDRFFTEEYNSDTYTSRGLKWVEDATLKKIIARHFPALEKHLPKEENKTAFFPWH